MSHVNRLAFPTHSHKTYHNILHLVQLLSNQVSWDTLHDKLIVIDVPPCPLEPKIKNVTHSSPVSPTCRQRRRAYVSSLLKTPGGRLGFVFRSSRWLGVSASRSLASSDDFVIGRLLTIASISHRNVCRQSSFRVCSFRRFLAMLLTVLICRSHTPPWWEPAGGLNIHSTFFCSIALWIADWFHWFSASLNCRSAPTKLVPLSDRISLT